MFGGDQFAVIHDMFMRNPNTLRTGRRCGWEKIDIISRINGNRNLVFIPINCLVPSFLPSNLLEKYSQLFLMISSGLNGDRNSSSSSYICEYILLPYSTGLITLYTDLPHILLFASASIYFNSFFIFFPSYHDYFQLFIMCLKLFEIIHKILPFIFFQNFLNIY